MGTVLVAGILVLVVSSIIVYMKNQKKKGISIQCGGDCKHCGGGCH